MTFIVMNKLNIKEILKKSRERFQISNIEHTGRFAIVDITEEDKERFIDFLEDSGLSYEEE